MKILYVSEAIGWSGGTQQALMMAGALQKRGHRITLACQAESELKIRAELVGLPTAMVRMRQDYDVPASFEIAKLVRALGIDVLHAQHPTAHALALMAAYWSSPRVFAVTRRVVFPLRRNLFSRLKYLSSRINGYVAISEAVRSELTRAGVRPDRIELIPSVMNRPLATREEGQALRKEWGFPPNALVITTLANYADFKGQDYLMGAVAKVIAEFPNARFLLAGRDTEKLSPLVQRLQVSSHVHLAGFRADVAQALAASDIFVLPSLQEAAGTALREAMAAGLPSIGTRVGGIPESIENGKTGLLVPPADSDALAEALKRYLRQPEECAHFGKEGQVFVNQHFSLPAASQKMEAFYQRLVSR